MKGVASLKRGLVLVPAILLFQFSAAKAQEKWTVSTALEYTGGSYGSSTTSSAYSLYGGLSYLSDDWSFSLNIPAVAVNSGLVSRVGGVFVPSMMNSSTSSRGGMMGGGMTGNSGSSTDVGLGDLYAYGRYRIFSSGDVSPNVWLTGMVKVPTASGVANYGTGKFDYGVGLSLNKMIGTFVLAADASYLIIGKTANADYENPLSYSFGVGKFFDGGKYSALLSYESLSRILPGYSAPRSIAIGFNDRLNDVTTLTVIGSAGLSNTSPAIDLTAGIGWTLF